MRAREPDHDGFVDRDGIKIAYEVFGVGEPTIIFLPSWQILHSRQWKLQAPYLSRHLRVITYDARGNGRSDRPVTAEQYAHREIVADAVAVLDAVGVSRAVFAGTSMGALYGLRGGRLVSRPGARAWSRSAAWRRSSPRSSQGRARSTTSARPAAWRPTAHSGASRATASSWSSSCGPR